MPGGKVTDLARVRMQREQPAREAVRLSEALEAATLTNLRASFAWSRLWLRFLTPWS